MLSYVFTTLSLLFPFVTAKDVKIIKKMVLTSEWHAMHPFAVQNTQHLWPLKGWVA